MRGNSSNFLVYHIYASNNKSIKGGIIMVALAESIVNSGTNLMMIIVFSMILTIIGLFFTQKRAWTWLGILILDCMLIVISTLEIPAYIIAGKSCELLIGWIALELIYAFTFAFLLTKEK